MVSLYCSGPWSCRIYAQKWTRTISRNWPSSVYSQPLLFSSSMTWKTWSTARGIMPTVSLVFQDDIIARFDGSILRGQLTTPPSIVKDFPDPVWP